MERGREVCGEVTRVHFDRLRNAATHDLTIASTTRASSAVTGIILTSDRGYFSSWITSAFPPAKDTADFLTARL